MSRVAIIGSCITRDLWPIRGGAQRCYISRTSLPSLFSPPIKGFRAVEQPPAGLARHQHRAVQADLGKTGLADLVAFHPTHLIFDFIDERFDLLSVARSLATHSWELEAGGYLKQPALRRARSIARLSGACEQLWRTGAAEMAAFIRATPLKDARLILHSARWAERFEDGAPLPATEVLSGRPASIAEHNRLLAAYEAEFRVLAPPLAVVEAVEHRFADPTHRWGASPFHYVPAYYEAIWTQLESLGVTREVSGPGASPSARAA